MFNHKRLMAVAVVVALAMALAVPSWGAKFRKKVTDQQFVEMCKKGDTQGVIKAIKSGAKVNAKDNNGFTALMWAAWSGHTETVNALIKARADVNAKDGFGRTALMEAVGGGHTEIVKALIKAGADDLTDNEGKTALICAAESEYSNPETVNALIDAGSYVKHRDNLGKTALDYARNNYRLEGTDALKRLEELSR